MHIYRDSADLNATIKRGTEWTVGFYTGSEFWPLSEHKHLDDAMSRVNYLNGGTGSTAPGR